MKKTFKSVLFLFLMTAGLSVLGAMDVDFGGEIDINVAPPAFDFVDSDAYWVNYYAHAWVNAEPISGSKLYLDVEAADLHDDRTFQVSRASIDFDIVKIAGLRTPLKIYTQVGAWEQTVAMDRYATWGGPEAVGSWDFKKGGWDKGLLDIQIGIDPLMFEYATELDLSRFAARVFGTVGPVEYSVGYTDTFAVLYDDYDHLASDTDESVMGQGAFSAEVNVNAQFTSTFKMSFPASFHMDFLDKANGENWMWYGLGMTLELGNLWFAAGTRGDMDNLITDTEFDLLYWLTDDLCIWYTTYLNPQWDPVFSGMDLGAEYRFGNVRLTGGFAFVPEGSGGYNAATYGGLWTDASGPYVQLHVDF